LCGKLGQPGTGWIGQVSRPGPALFVSGLQSIGQQ